MVNSNRGGPGLYAKAKQKEASKLASSGSPRNKRLAALRAKRAEEDDKEDPTSYDAISTDPPTKFIDYGDDQIPAPPNALDDQSMHMHQHAKALAQANLTANVGKGNNKQGYGF